MVSRFLGFAEHLTLAQTTLRQIYDADGPHTISPCFTPGNIGFTNRRSIGGGRLDPPAFTSTPVSPPPGPGPLLPADFPIGGNPPFPDELDEPPLDWRLPGALADSSRGSIACRCRSPSPVSRSIAAPCSAICRTTRCSAFPTPPPRRWSRASPMVRAGSTRSGCAPRSRSTGAAALRRFAFGTLSTTTAVPRITPIGGRWTSRSRCCPAPMRAPAFLVGSLAGIRTRLPRGEYRAGPGLRSGDRRPAAAASRPGDHGAEGDGHAQVPPGERSHLAAAERCRGGASAHARADHGRRRAQSARHHGACGEGC